MVVPRSEREGHVRSPFGASPRGNSNTLTQPERSKISAFHPVTGLRHCWEIEKGSTASELMISIESASFGAVQVRRVSR